jgi:hypothetical protein
MKPVVFIRIASVLLFIHAVLHTVGGVFGKVNAGPAAMAVAAMKTNQFMVMGNVRTFWDFYIGMGLGVTISLTVESVALWFLAPLAASHGEKLRPALAAFAIGYLVFAVNSFRHFFLAPVITEILIAACLGLAIATARSPSESFQRTPVRA